MKSFDEIEQTVNEFVIDLNRRTSYSLDRIEDILNQFDNPQDSFKTVHIAGTSGKSSTAYYTAAILQEAGYKVGLSVSPYVEHMNERVQIGTEPLPENEFCREFTEFFNKLNKLSVIPTYFELFVAFAYWYFAKSGVEYAVVEVGLGGLLDGTNVILRPDKVCIITDIGLDHTHVLGRTKAEIARQKAGIIQSHNHVFMYRQGKEIDEAIMDRCAEKHASVQFLKPEDSPDFLNRNFTLARAACEFIFVRDGRQALDAKVFKRAKNTYIPGRLEKISYKGKTIILDGAHNSQKARSLAKNIKESYPAKSIAVLLAVGGNKQVHLEDITQEIKSLAEFTIVSTFTKGHDTSSVSIEPSHIAQYLDKDSLLIEPDLNKAFKSLLQREEDVLLITGSLYLVGAAKKLLKALQAD
jgi:dihydrofolate synthase/folylpolyglutamate synthase